MADSVEREIRELRGLFWSERDPDGRAFVALADAYRQMGDLDQALELLDDGLRRHGDFAPGHIVAGWVHRARGQAELAERAFGSALALDEENTEALRGLAEVASERGDGSRAADWWRRLAELEPADDEIRARLADAERLGDRSNAWGGSAAEADPWGADPDRVEAEEGAPATDDFELPGDDIVLQVAQPADGGVPDLDAPPPPEPPSFATAAPPPSPAVEEDPWASPVRAPAGEDDVPVTRTMADLYARQNLYDRALRLYRQLLERSPADASLAERVSEMEARVAEAEAQAAAAAAPPEQAAEESLSAQEPTWAEPVADAEPTRAAEQVAPERTSAEPVAADAEPARAEPIAEPAAAPAPSEPEAPPVWIESPVQVPIGAELVPPVEEPIVAWQPVEPAAELVEPPGEPAPAEPESAEPAARAEPSVAPPLGRVLPRAARPERRPSDQEVETLARDWAEGPGDAGELRTPFAWSPRPQRPGAPAAEAGRPIADYFRSLLAWEPAGSVEPAADATALVAAPEAEPAPADTPESAAVEAAPLEAEPIEAAEAAPVEAAWDEATPVDATVEPTPIEAAAAEPVAAAETPTAAEAGFEPVPSEPALQAVPEPAPSERAPEDFGAPMLPEPADELVSLAPPPKDAPAADVAATSGFDSFVDMEPPAAEAAPAVEEPAAELIELPTFAPESEPEPEPVPEVAPLGASTELAALEPAVEFEPPSGALDLPPIETAPLGGSIEEAPASTAAAADAPTGHGIVPIDSLAPRIVDIASLAPDVWSEIAAAKPPKPAVPAAAAAVADPAPATIVPIESLAPHIVDIASLAPDPGFAGRSG